MGFGEEGTDSETPKQNESKAEKAQVKTLFAEKP